MLSNYTQTIYHKATSIYINSNPPLTRMEHISNRALRSSKLIRLADFILATQRIIWKREIRKGPMWIISNLSSGSPSRLFTRQGNSVDGF
jgi:hypothetical protein